MKTAGNLGLTQWPTGYNGWGPQMNTDMQTIDSTVTALMQSFKGAWNAAVIYSQGQFVTYGGNVYVSTISGNVNQNPTTSAWAQLGGGGGVTITAVAIGPTSGPPDFTIAHGLGTTPASVVIEMKSAGAIWFQSPEYDDTNLYLTASDAGLTASAKCIV
jgi:hypothetical protein